jgi:ketosteroid isomerase-like protein
MKKTIFVTILMAAMLNCAQAQKKPPGPAGGTTQALMDLENRWVDALVRSDAEAIDSMFADSYVETDEQDQRNDKQGVLAALKSGDLKLKSIKLSDLRVHDYGNAAVVTGSAKQAGDFKGQPLPGKLIFTDTFVRQKGKWRAVASHRSAV